MQSTKWYQILLIINLEDSYTWERESESHSVCPILCDPMDSPWNSPGQNPGVGSLSLLQGIFPTQGLNPGLPHWILYQLSHKGSLRILQWVVYLFSSRSSPPRNRTGVSCIAGRFFTSFLYQGSPIYMGSTIHFFRLALFQTFFPKG